MIEDEMPLVKKIISEKRKALVRTAVIIAIALACGLLGLGFFAVLGTSQSPHRQI